MDTAVASKVGDAEYAPPIDNNFLKPLNILKSHTHTASQHANATTDLVDPLHKGEITNSGTTPSVQPVVFFPCFQMDASPPKGTSKRPKTKTRMPRVLVAEPIFTQRRVAFQPQVNAEQHLRVTVVPAAEPMAVIIASISVDAFQGAQQILQVDTKSKT